MKQMSAAEFKAKCLAVMDRVRATGEPVVVTKRGKPVVRVAPAPVAGRSPLGSLAGTFEITGDIVGPASDLSDGAAGDAARQGAQPQGIPASPQPACASPGSAGCQPAAARAAPAARR